MNGRQQKYYVGTRYLLHEIMEIVYTGKTDRNA